MYQLHSEAIQLSVCYSRLSDECFTKCIEVLCSMHFDANTISKISVDFVFLIDN